MKNTKILISGGGIAGTALAYWLHRHGATPTVVERAGAIRDGGYKVDLRGAALDVVERMGILERIRKLRTDVRGGSVVDAAGRRVASMDGDTFGGRVHGDAELLRGDLNQLLYELTRDDVEYRFDDSIAELHDTAGGVDVTFESGDTGTFDLVIGADGVHSRTRALAFGAEADAGAVRDLGYYVSIFSVPNHLELDRWELTYVGPGRTALVYSTARQDDAKAMFLFASPPLHYDPRDRAAQERLLAEAYAGEGWEVPRLLDGMAAAPDFYFDSLSQVHLDSLVPRPGRAGRRRRLLRLARLRPGHQPGAGRRLRAGRGAGPGRQRHRPRRPRDRHETGFAAYERELRAVRRPEPEARPGQRQADGDAHQEPGADLDGDALGREPAARQGPADGEGRRADPPCGHRNHPQGLLTPAPQQRRRTCPITTPAR